MEEAEWGRNDEVEEVVVEMEEGNARIKVRTKGKRTKTGDHVV